jgi:hypothetical protein
MKNLIFVSALVLIFLATIAFLTRYDNQLGRVRKFLLFLQSFNLGAVKK